MKFMEKRWMYNVKKTGFEINLSDISGAKPKVTNIQKDFNFDGGTRISQF